MVFPDVRGDQELRATIQTLMDKIVLEEAMLAERPRPE
jgi:hypothetical protein